MKITTRATTVRRGNADVISTWNPPVLLLVLKPLALTPGAPRRAAFVSLDNVFALIEGHPPCLRQPLHRYRNGMGAPAYRRITLHLRRLPK